MIGEGKLPPTVFEEIGEKVRREIEEEDKTGKRLH